MVAGAVNQCTAKSKRSGNRCERFAMNGSTKCHMHGGKSLKGIASPALKSGKFSKYIPPRMLDRYHEAAADSELLELNHEIALVDSRLADLLTRVDSGEAGKLWADARKLNLEIQKAVHDENYGLMMMKAVELDFIIGTGLTDHEAWMELSSLIEQRRKLVESEQKRRIAMKSMVAVDEALLFAGALLDSIKRNVTDRNQLNAIQIDFARLMNAETKSQVQP